MAARNTMDNAIDDINRRMNVIDFYHEKNMIGSAQNEHKQLRDITVEALRYARSKIDNARLQSSRFINEKTSLHARISKLEAQLRQLMQEREDEREEDLYLSQALEEVENPKNDSPDSGVIPPTQ